MTGNVTIEKVKNGYVVEDATGKLVYSDFQQILKDLFINIEDKCSLKSNGKKVTINVSVDYKK